MTYSFFNMDLKDWLETKPIVLTLSVLIVLTIDLFT